MQQELFGNRHKFCPNPEDRNPIKLNWSCQEYFAFNNYEYSFQIIGLICKSYQIILFTFLWLILFYRRYTGDGQTVSFFPILISTLVILDAVLALLRVNAIFPFYLS